MSEHGEIESLLGAYALDAVTSDEALEVEAHLRECPRCRAELASYEEVAAALGNVGAEAPEGLWERIAESVQLEEGLEETEPPPLRGAAPLSVFPGRRRRVVALVSSGLGAIAAAVVVLLGVQLGHLNGELNNLQHADAGQGLAPLVAAVALGQHQRLVLASASSNERATIEIAPDGSAYWVASSLATLPTGGPQLWASVGDRLVSIGLLGRPHDYARLRIEKDMRELLVTAEPEGGSPAPTGSVLVKRTLPALT